jgi:hypothetical protein
MRGIALMATAAYVAATGAGCQTMSSSAFSALGPSGAGAGTAGFSYIGGRAVQTFAQSPVTVQPVVLAALDDLRVQALRQTNDGGAIVFECTTADNRRASVTLRPHPAGSRLSARIGLFGDEPLSRALMDRVAIRLGNLPPAAIPAEPPSQPGSNPYFSRTAIPDSEMFKDLADAPYRDTPVSTQKPY